MICVNDIYKVYKYSSEREEWYSSSKKCHIMSYQLDGHYDHCIGGKNGNLLEVKSDSLFFINKSDSYYVRKKQTGTSICISFDGETDLPTQILDCKKNPHIKNLFSRALSCKKLSDKSNFCFVSAILYELIGILYRDKTSSYIAAKNRDIVVKAAEYIEQNCLSCSFRVSDIPGTETISKKYFRTLFKKHFGTSPQEYLSNIRLSKAYSYLSENGFNVTETAMLSGFNDIYYFSRVFKKRFGVPPSEFESIDKDKLIGKQNKNSGSMT